MKDKNAIQRAKEAGRRRFLSLAGAAGAGLLLGKQSALADEAPHREGEAPVEPGSHERFDPAETAPRYDPRELPKPGEKVHEYDIELVLTTHEIVPRITYHAYAYNGTVPGPEIRVR